MHVRGSVHVLKFRAPYDVENLKFWIYVSGWGNFFFSLSFFEFTLNYYNSRFLQFKALTFVKNGLMWVLLLIKYLQWIMYQRWKRDRARMSFNDGWYSRIYEESLWIWAHQRRNEIKSSSPHSILSLIFGFPICTLILTERWNGVQATKKNCENFSFSCNVN